MKKQEKKIIEIIDKLRPFLINDGGNVEFVKYEDGYVYIRNGLFEYSPNIWKFPFKTVLLSGGGFYRFLKGTSMSKVLRKHINNHDTFMIYFHPFEIHKGYLPMPKRGLLSVQKKYLQKNREVYLDSIEQMIGYLKEQGYTFSNMKEYTLAKQKEYK